MCSQLELLKQQKEEEEAMQIRQETNFVANPVRRYRSMVVRPSNPEDITIPKTPKFMKNQSKDWFPRTLIRHEAIALRSFPPFLN